MQPERGPHASPDPRVVVRTTMRLGQELLAVPRAERGLEWHVKAQFLGDLPSLGSGIIRAEQLADRAA